MSNYTVRNDIVPHIPVCMPPHDQYEPLWILAMAVMGILSVVIALLGRLRTKQRLESACAHARALSGDTVSACAPPYLPILRAVEGGGRDENDINSTVFYDRRRC